jgi:ribosomal protein S18 acetylase RimI-like enzyme
MTPAGSEGPLLGFIIGYPSGRTGIIYTLDVHPSCRRQGIGRALIQSIEEKLRSSGARTCRLEAASANPAALCLYKGEGYKEGELIRDYYGNGCHAVRCWKDLDG